MSYKSYGSTNSLQRILTFLRSYVLTLFLLSPFSFLPCSGQVKRSPKESPRFVYQSSLSLAYGVGNISTDAKMSPNNNLSFEIEQIVAYQFNNYIFTGLGTGLDFWFCEKKTSPFIPIFANATVKFIDKKTAPFLFVNLGYAFKWQTENKVEETLFYGTKAGICFKTGIGLNLKFSEKISFLLSAYYKMQQSAVQFRESDILLVETKNQLFHFIGVKISVLY